MKYFGWLLIVLVIVLGGSGQVFAADNSRMTWGSDTQWGNTDWGNSSWGNTNWGPSDWGNTDWNNTNWRNTGQTNTVQYLEGEKPIGQLMKVTLGIKKPDGFCAVIVTWEKSNEEAIRAVAKSCQDCIIDNLASSGTPGLETAGGYCQ
jgi:hypothetical protein